MFTGGLTVFALIISFLVMAWVAQFRNRSAVLWCLVLLGVAILIYLAGAAAYLEYFGSDGKEFYENGWLLLLLLPASCFLALLALSAFCLRLKDNSKKFAKRHVEYRV